MQRRSLILTGSSDLVETTMVVYFVLLLVPGVTTVSFACVVYQSVDHSGGAAFISSSSSGVLHHHICFLIIKTGKNVPHLGGMELADVGLEVLKDVVVAMVQEGQQGAVRPHQPRQVNQGLLHRLQPVNLHHLTQHQYQPSLTSQNKS